MPMPRTKVQTEKRFQTGAGVRREKAKQIAHRTQMMTVLRGMLHCAQNLKRTMPMPFRPPQIMKFQLAPCQRPPSSIVSMELTCVRRNFRWSGRRHAYRRSRRAMTATAKATHQEPLRNEPMTATAMMMM